MLKHNSKSKPKHEPRGLTILYEDRDIVVVDKVSGLLTMGNEKVRDKTAYRFLNDYVRKGNPKSRNRIFIVHRLDRDTSGVLVFAKTESAKRYLQDEWQNFDKKYYALVHGAMPEKEGVIVSYLEENRKYRMYSGDDPNKGKLARTGYKVLRESAKFSLLEITLFTGRKHQIRVQLADQGCPVVGDKKYGRPDKGIRRLTLHAGSLTIRHPHTKAMMTFTARNPSFFAALMSENRLNLAESDSSKKKI